MASISITLLRHSQPDAYPVWASSSALLGAVGFSLVAAYVWISGGSAEQAHALLLTSAALVCWIGYAVARRGNPVAGALTAFVALWLEIHLSFVLASAFPSTGLLATPLMTITAGLVFGAPVAFWLSLLSVLITAPLVLLSPAGDSAMLSNVVYWLVVHAVITLAVWGLVSVSLSALSRIVGQLESREQELETVIREAPDGILLLSGTNYVLTANPAAERILGVAGLATREAPLGEVLSEAGAADPASLLQLLDRSGDAEGAGPVLWPLPGATSGASFAEVTQRPISKDRWQLMLRDVSPRVNAALTEQEAAQHTAHAQRLEAVGQLAGGIAHDFNNLLLAIGANAELLRGPLSEDERTTLLDELISAQERGASLTRQLLAFARKDMAHPTVLDLGALVSELTRLLQRVAGDGVHLQVAATGETSVRADRLQLEQVLVNLVANARDAMPVGGVCSITVDGPCGPGTDNGTGNVVRVCVADGGVGMAPETITRAVEPFFTTKPRGRGTGLGLSTAHGFVAQSGGRLDIESAPEQGTRVIVTLPHESQPAPSNEAARDAEDPLAAATPRQVAPRILVAEDDDSTRAVVGRILKRAGYECTLVPDGEQALRAIAQDATGFELVISDVAMPVLDGPSMAVQIRKQLPNLPILFMSGYPESGFEGLGTFDPDRDFLPKPFTSAGLLQRVEAQLVRASA